MTTASLPSAGTPRPERRAPSPIAAALASLLALGLSACGAAPSVAGDGGSADLFACDVSSTSASVQVDPSQGCAPDAAWCPGAPFVAELRGLDPAAGALRIGIGAREFSLVLSTGTAFVRSSAGTVGGCAELARSWDGLVDGGAAARAPAPAQPVDPGEAAAARTCGFRLLLATLAELGCPAVISATAEGTLIQAAPGAELAPQ